MTIEHTIFAHDSAPTDRYSRGFATVICTCGERFRAEAAELVPLDAQLGSLRYSNTQQRIAQATYEAAVAAFVLHRAWTIAAANQIELF